MTRKFKPSCDLTIAQRGGTEAIRLDDKFRIVFTVSRDTKAKSNKSIVHVYNLNDSSLSKISQKDSFIVLNAGYEGKNKLVTTGDIKKVTFAKYGPDRIVQIEALDQTPDPKKTLINISFQKQRPVSDFIKQIATTTGLTIITMPNINQTIAWGRGGAFSGTVADALTFATKRIDAVWTIQDDEIIIYKDGTPFTNTILSLTAQSGLLSAEKIEEDSKGGVRFSALLTPELQPGSQVSIIGETVNGVYTCKRIGHDCDTRGTNWFTTGEAF